MTIPAGEQLDHIDSLLLGHIVGALEPGEHRALDGALRARAWLQRRRSLHIRRLFEAGVVATPRIIPCNAFPMPAPRLDASLVMDDAPLSEGDRIVLGLPEGIDAERWFPVLVRGEDERRELLYPREDSAWQPLARFRQRDGEYQLEILVPGGSLELLLVLVPAADAKLPLDLNALVAKVDRGELPGWSVQGGAAQVSR